ncbi:MAG: hypothetical protein JW708_00795 [Vallitaleaceae bacterium]|nr:hypothetical protein [Vallitaleaceae bacterium]
MKKARIIIIFIVVIGALSVTVFIANQVRPEESQYNFISEAGYYNLIAEDYLVRIEALQWDSLDKSVLRYKEVEEFLYASTQCIDHVAERTNRKNWTKELSRISEEGKAIVIVEIKEEVTSRALQKEGIVVLNKTEVEQDFFPLEHELTHIVMGICSEGTLSEGFACYMSQKELGVIDTPGFELESHTVAKVCLDEPYISQYKTFLEVIGYATDSTIMDNENKTGFYVFAYSYVDYLVASYGLDAVVELYNSHGNEEAYEKVLGRQSEEIKNEWLNYLNQKDIGMTSDEVIEYILEKRKFYHLD